MWSSLYLGNGLIAPSFIKGASTQSIHLEDPFVRANQILRRTDGSAEIHSIYPPTGGAGENTSSSGSGVSTAEMKAYNAKVALAGNKGMEGRKASKASIDPKEVERQVLRDELFAQEKRLAGLTTELKKTKGTLAERTTELRSQRRRSRIITGKKSIGQED
jgi:hypothetical protein